MACWTQGSDLAHRRPGYCEIDSHNVDEFKLWHATDVRAAIDLVAIANARVAAGAMTATDRNDLELVLGLNFKPDGIIASTALTSHVDPVAVCTYDWVHNVLQDGVLATEIGAFLIVAEVARVDVLRFFRDERWIFPRSSRDRCKSLWRVFEEKRVSAADQSKVKASCAELLGLYSMLRHFVECVVAPVEAHDAARQSFLAVCEMIDAILAAKFRFTTVAHAAALVQTRAVQHLQLHKAAYGNRFIKPKHHWQLDVAAQILRDGLVLDAFVVERGHLAVKAVADKVQNTTTFEASVMASLSSSVWSKDRPISAEGLVGTTSVLPGVDDAWVADNVEIMAVTIAVDDVVVRGHSVGLVKACCLHNTLLCAFVEPLAIEMALSVHADMLTCTGNLEVWPAAELRLAVAWQRTGASFRVVRM